MRLALLPIAEKEGSNSRRMQSGEIFRLSTAQQAVVSKGVSFVVWLAAPQPWQDFLLTGPTLLGFGTVRNEESRTPPSLFCHLKGNCAGVWNSHSQSRTQTLLVVQFSFS